MIIFFYGENTFQAQQKLAQLKAKFFKDVPDGASSFVSLDGQSADLGDLDKLSSTSSLFSPKRLIIIKNIFSNKTPSLIEKLLTLIKDKNLVDSPDVLIVYEPQIKSQKKSIVKIKSAGQEAPLNALEKKLFTLLNSQKYAQELPLPKESEIVNFIKQEASAKKLKISPGAIQTLANFCGQDLWMISGELDKLKHFKDKETIEEADIKKISDQLFNDNIFALTDAWGQKNRALAINLLEQQLAGGAPEEYLLTMLIKQIKNLIQIKSLGSISASEIATKLKLHPYVVQKGLNSARYFEASDLKKLYNQLMLADYNFKTGAKDLRLSLNIILAEI